MNKKIRETASVDSGFLYALINRNDSNHEKAKKAAQKYDKQWITTCFVFHEVFVLLNDRDPGCPHLIPKLFEMEKRGLLHVVDFEKAWLVEIEHIVKKYSDQRLDLADASLIFLAEKLGHGDIFTTDINDFSFCRWNKNKSFNILLLC